MSVDGRRDRAVSQPRTGRRQRGLGILDGRAALVARAECLRHLHLAHRVALQRAAYGLIMLLGIGVFAAGGGQGRLGLAHGVAQVGSVNRKQYLPAAHQLAGLVSRRRHGAVDAAHHIDRAVGRQCARVVAVESDGVCDHLGYIDTRSGAVGRGGFLAVAAGGNQGCCGIYDKCVFCHRRKFERNQSVANPPPRVRYRSMRAESARPRAATTALVYSR